MGRQVIDKYLLSDKGGKREPPGIEIRRGRDLATNESVTVKVFDTSTFFFVHGGVRELIKFEVSTMSRLDHPNVVRLVDVLASPSKIFMVMETVSGGGRLHEAIAAAGRLEDRTAGSYFRQLLDAVEHCHSKGVCHRDIQPANILLDRKGNVKLAGFALAGVLDPSVEGGQATVVQGLTYDGKAADVWSLGVTLVTMLAGYLPFQGESEAVVLNTALAGGFKHAPGITTSARALLDGMLDPNPSTRFTAALVRRQPWFVAQTQQENERRKQQQQLQQQQQQQQHQQGSAFLPTHPDIHPTTRPAFHTDTDQQASSCGATCGDSSSSSPDDDVRRHLGDAGKGRFVLAGDGCSNVNGGGTGRRSLTLGTLEPDLPAAAPPAAARGRDEKTDDQAWTPELSRQNYAPPPLSTIGSTVETDFSSCGSDTASTIPDRTEDAGTSSSPSSTTPERVSRGCVAVHVQRLGPRRLLFSVPAAGPAALAKGLRRALEGIGCTCREGLTSQPPDEGTAPVSVEACRDVVGAAGAAGGVEGGKEGAGEGERVPALSVRAVLCVLVPGEGPPDAVVNPPRRAAAEKHLGGRGHRRSGGSVGSGCGASFSEGRCHGSSATTTAVALAACGSASSTDSGELDVPEVPSAGRLRPRSMVRSDNSSSRTDVLVVLHGGQVSTFNRLVEDLLASEGGASIFRHDGGLHRGVCNGDGVLATG